MTTRVRGWIVALAVTFCSVEAFQPASGVANIARLAVKPLFRPAVSKPCRIKKHEVVTRSPFSSTIGPSVRRNQFVALKSTAVAGATPAIAWWYMTLLAFQFGAQPILTKKYAPTSICRSTIVLAQEVTKFVMAGSLLYVSGSWAPSVAGMHDEQNEMCDKHVGVILLTLVFLRVTPFPFPTNLYRLVHLVVVDYCWHSGSPLRGSELLLAHGVSELGACYF